jgi:hypothetical protein
MRTVIGIFGALALTGCTTTGMSMSGGEYAARLALSKQAQTVLSSAPASLPADSPSDALFIYLAQRNPDEPLRRRAVANATARALMLNSDLACEQYMRDVIKRIRTTKSVLGVSSLALSGAAGVTTPVRSANLLSALSAFSSSADAKLSTTVLADKAPELLYKAVMAQRSEERSRLLTLLVNADLGEAAPGVVMAQLAEYHSRCGPTVGINGLEASVENKTEQAPEKGAERATSFVRGAMVRTTK